MTTWQGKFVPIEAKGLDKKKVPAKKPQTSGVKKDITKEEPTKVPASAAEKLLKDRLIRDTYKVIFANEDPRVMLLLKGILFKSISDVDFQEAAIKAQVHLDATYGKYKQNEGSEFNIYDALSPFGGGELTQREKNTLTLYLWFLYGKEPALANKVFENILNRERVSVDLENLVNVYAERIYSGKNLWETVKNFENAAQNIILNTSFFTVEFVYGQAQMSDFQRNVSLNQNGNSDDRKKFRDAVLGLDLSDLTTQMEENVFLVCILLMKDNLAQDEIIEIQNELSSKIFRRISVDKTRLLLGIGMNKRYWQALVERLVAEEKIDPDSVVAIVGELRGMTWFTEQQERELLDATTMLQLTRDLASTELDENRRGGFQFRG